MQQRRKRILTYTLITLVAGFILLSVFVSLFPESVIDREFSIEVQEHRNPMLDVAMKAVSWPGYVENALPIAFVTALLFFLFKYKKEALFIILSLASGLVSTLVKMAVNRPRPSHDLVQVIVKTQQKSFPSGHTLFYVVFFGFLVILMYTLKNLPVWLRLGVSILSLLLIFIIPFSRVYLGAHWFTDVLGGFILGLLCLALLAYFFLRKNTEKAI
jgi:membrane-associated phospholipid phosphatase